jgi:DNA-directed RNA polymerase subunit alpha
VGARSGDAEDAEQGQRRNPYLDRSLDELELSVATSNALAEGGVRTIGELCRRTETEVLKLRNIGRKGLREIKEILSALGLSLGMRGV